MCTFITLIAASRDLDRLNAILAAQDCRGQHRRAETISTPGLSSLLAAGEQEYWLYRRICDCDTYLGSALQGLSLASNQHREARKYRRKGWSEAKIARTLADRTDADSRRRRKRLQEDASYWIDLLREIGAGLSVPRLGLMHHFYRHSPGIEDFGADRTSAGRIEAATDVLAKMPEDVIHDFDVGER